MNKNKKLVKSNLDKKIPKLKGFRRFLLNIVRILVSVFFPFKLHNPERAPKEGPALYMANHVAMFDIPVMCFPLKENWVFWVSKKEVSDYWYYRPLFSWWQNIIVDTDRIDLTAVREIMGRLKQNQIIGIYPQATRIKTNERLRENPPKAGVMFFAIKFDCPIYPVMIDGTFSLFKRTNVYFGKPFKIKISKEEMNEKQELVSFQVMNELFSLANRNYYEEMGREDLQTEERFIEYI